MIEFIGEYPFTEPLIFDSHAHYEDMRFESVKEQLFNGLKASGVAGIVTCGCDPESSLTAQNLAELYDFVYYSAGIHPESVDCLEKISLDTAIEQIKGIAAHKKCVAIGEIGLDYYWTQDNIPLQKQVFIRQLELAKELEMPVIVHDREAHADTLELLKAHKPQGVVHSFSGSREMAEEIFKLGMYIGISGVITFKNARKLPEVVESMPLERFLLETDAPYLAPVPYRSKINHSAMIYWSAQKIAEIRGMKTEEILKIGLDNAKKFYKI